MLAGLISLRRSQHGEVAEWSNAVVLKTIDGLNCPGVRIPPSPPIYKVSSCIELLFIGGALFAHTADHTKVSVGPL